MIVALLFIALLQDGPVRTAPTAEPASQTGAATEGRAAVVAAREAEAANEEAANPRDAVNRSPSGQSNVGEGRYGRLPGAAATPESGVPAWALTDPARWESSQCGAEGDDACRRQARNRLAMARAGIAAEPPAPTGGGAAAAPQNCRMVMRRSESGFGGSLSRVCGDAAATEATLDRFEDSLRPAVEPCDRPANLESQDAWIARCRALPPR